MTTEQQLNRNPIIFLNPQKDTGRSNAVEDDLLYKTYDSKSNQEVFSEKMNL